VFASRGDLLASLDSTAKRLHRFSASGGRLTSALHELSEDVSHPPPRRGMVPDEEMRGKRLPSCGGIGMRRSAPPQLLPDRARTSAHDIFYGARRRDLCYTEEFEAWRTPQT